MVLNLYKVVYVNQNPNGATYTAFLVGSDQEDVLSILNERLSFPFVINMVEFRGRIDALSNSALRKIINDNKNNLDTYLQEKKIKKKGKPNGNKSSS